MSTPGTPAWLRAMAEREEKAADNLREIIREHQDLKAHQEELQSGVDAHVALREGLLRAANRIERLQAELAKQKTGVDPTHCPPPAPRRPAPSFPRQVERPQVPIYRVRMPASEFATDQRDYERFFDWINGSENLGMGLLDPCEVFVLGDPDVDGGTWDFDTVIGVSTLMKDKHPKGFVRISGTSRKGPLNLLAKSLGSIDLKGCMVLDVEASDDETIIEFVAQSAEPVKVEEDDEAE